MSFEAETSAKEIKKLHEHVRAQIQNMNEQCRSKANKNCTHLEFIVTSYMAALLRGVLFKEKE